MDLAESYVDTSGLPGADQREVVAVGQSTLESKPSMNPSFEQTLIEVWRQALVENAKVAELGKECYPVRRTPKRGLRQVDFVFFGMGCCRTG
jgi:hypothetical protein